EGGGRSGAARDPRRPPRHGFARLEALESRLNPATFTESGTLLTITLTNANEGLTLHAGGFASITVDESAGNTTSGAVPSMRVTGLGTPTATITAIGITYYTQIAIRATAGVHGGHVTFADT